MSLRLSPTIYNVSGMLIISENQVPYGCGGRSAGVRFGLSQLEAGLTEGEVACRLATGQVVASQLERDWHGTGVEPIGRVAVAAGSGTAIVIEQKRPV